MKVVVQYFEYTIHHSTSTCSVVSSLSVTPEPENCGLNGILTLPKSIVFPTSLLSDSNVMTSPCVSSSV